MIDDENTTVESTIEPDYLGVLGSDYEDSGDVTNVDESTNTSNADENDQETSDEDTSTLEVVRKIKIGEIEVDEADLIAAYNQREADKAAVEASRVDVSKMTETEMRNRLQLSELEQYLPEINRQIALKVQIDWTRWFAEDQKTAVQARAELDALEATKEMYENLKASVAQAEQARKTGPVFDVESFRADVVKAIPDFDELKPYIIKAGIAEGYTIQELNSIHDVRDLKILAKAARIDKMNPANRNDGKTHQKQTQPIRSQGNSVGTGPIKPDYLKAFG